MNRLIFVRLPFFSIIAMDNSVVYSTIVQMFLSYPIPITAYIRWLYYLFCITSLDLFFAGEMNLVNTYAKWLRDDHYHDELPTHVSDFTRGIRSRCLLI